MSPRLSRAPAIRRKRRMPLIAGIGALLLLLALVRAMTITPRPTRSFLDDSGPVIIAHQGASGHAPSNTMEAFWLALEQGADILELDLFITKDGVMVVSHDETIDRMSNGIGYIKDMTLAELRQFDFGYTFSLDDGQTYPYRAKNVIIPTLEEVFVAFPDKRINMEIKRPEPPMEEAVWQLIRQHQMEEKVLVASFFPEVGKRWRALTGNATAISATRGDMYEFVAYWLPGFGFLYNPKVDAFQLPTSQKLGPVTVRLDTPRLLKLAAKLNVKVHYWTVNDEPTMRRLLEAGADGIITDFPDRMLKVMKEMGHR